MICFVESKKGTNGKPVYLGCYRVVSMEKEYDWEVDGLPPQLKERVSTYLTSVEKYYGISS